MGALQTARARLFLIVHPGTASHRQRFRIEHIDPIGDVRLTDVQHHAVGGGHYSDDAGAFRQVERDRPGGFRRRTAGLGLGLSRGHRAARYFHADEGIASENKDADHDKNGDG